MKSTFFILFSLLLVSCASQKTKNLAGNDLSKSKIKDLSYYNTKIKKSETNKDFENLVRSMMEDKNMTIDQKTKLLENVKSRISNLSDKKEYINQKLKVDAKLTVETQTRVGELSGSINNLGGKVITQMNVLINSSDIKVKDMFPMKLTLTASDNQLNMFDFKVIVSDVPSDWNKDLTITVEDATFLNK